MVAETLAAAGGEQHAGNPCVGFGHGR